MRSTYGMDRLPKHRNIRLRVYNGKTIENTKRVERVLNLIKYLNYFRTIRQIASYLEIHEKSVNRYLNLMVQLGFKVEVSHSKYHHYRIKNGWEYFN